MKESKQCLKNFVVARATSSIRDPLGPQYSIPIASQTWKTEERNDHLLFKDELYFQKKGLKRMNLRKNKCISSTIKKGHFQHNNFNLV